MTGRPTRGDVARAIARHRSLLAAGLAAGAVAASLGVLAPAPPIGRLVLRAASDLPAGKALTLEDVVTARVVADALPAGALTSAELAVGHLLAAPVRRGEVLTDLRLAGAALLPASRTDLVAVPVRLADAASVALLSPGDRIDVLAATTAPGGVAPLRAQLVAVGAEVLAVPSTGADSGEGALVVLAQTPEVAARLAAAALSSRLSFTLRPGS